MIHRMLCLFGLALGLAIAQQASAQVVTVRSGEHGRFTRLVLTLPEPGGWDFGRSTTGYELRLRGKIDRFDLDRVFQRIDRRRIEALDPRPAEGSLGVALGCACHAIATPFRPGIIIIDIAEGPAPENSPFEAALDGPEPLWHSAPPGPRPPPRPRLFAEMPALPPLGPRRLRERGPLAPQAQALQIPDARARLLGERLAREFSRGVASGAISAEGPLPQPMATRSRPVVLPATTPPATADAPSPQLHTRPPGEPPSREPPDSGTPCFAAPRLALERWGDGRPPALQVSDARRALLQEFDRPNPEAVQKLARLYLHLGFGAEARGLMADWLPDWSETPLLRAVGASLDDLPPDPSLAGMEACDGPAALWSVLGQSQIPATTDRAAVVRAFSSLPLWLRRELGPRLIPRFLAVGDLATAQSLEQALIRGQPLPSAQSQLIESQIDLARGAPDRAEPRLQAVAETNSALAPAALVALVESRIAHQQPLLPDQVTTLEALAHEHRAASDGPSLRRSLARALVATGQPDRAFGEIAAATPGLYPELWALLTQRGSDADIARQALAPHSGALRDLPRQTRLDLAGRLITGGFPDAALTLIEAHSGPEVDLLRARAELRRRDGRAALRHLAGSEAPGAQGIRAEALELLGDYPAAEAAWAAAENGPRSERLRLLQQQWQDLPSTSSEGLRSLAASLTPDTGLPPEPLARARALLGNSEGLRATSLAVLRAGDGS